MVLALDMGQLGGGRRDEEGEEEEEGDEEGDEEKGIAGWSTGRKGASDSGVGFP